MKAFVAIPTNKVKRYCWPVFWKNTAEVLSKSGFDVKVLIVDNSSDDEFYFQMKNDVNGTRNILPDVQVERLDIEVDWDKEKDEKHLFRLFSKNLNTTIVYQMREFLKTNHGFFVSLESDVIIPEGSLDLLYSSFKRFPAYNKVGIGGIYYDGNVVHLDEWFDPSHNEVLRCSDTEPNLLVCDIKI